MNMKVLQCDHCGKTELACKALNWLELKVPSESPHQFWFWPWSGSGIFCSWECLAAWLESNATKPPKTRKEE